jgi:hypothetical protein
MSIGEHRSSEASERTRPRNHTQSPTQLTRVPVSDLASLTRNRTPSKHVGASPIVPSFVGLSQTASQEHVTRPQIVPRADRYV